MDRLDLIESRWREAGCGDGDKGWLIAEVRNLRAFAEPILRVYADTEHTATSNAAQVILAARCRQPRRGWLARLWRLLGGRA